MATKKSDARQKAESFWNTRRIEMADQMGGNHGGESLSLEARLEVVRLMAAENQQTTINIARLASATKELAGLLDKASKLAEEVADLNRQNKLVPLAAPPVREDPDDWKRAIERTAREVASASRVLEQLAPDVVQQIGAIDTSPEPKKR